MATDSTFVRVQPTYQIAAHVPGIERDAALEELLWKAYVEDGHTSAEVGRAVFTAQAVSKRGHLLVMFDTSNEKLVGCVIVVPHNAAARRIAELDEAEMQLLAACPANRGRGIGERLVREAMRAAREGGYRKLVLWTQPSMAAAQRLYTRCGFSRSPERDFVAAEREFLVYGAQL